MKESSKNPTLILIPAIEQYESLGESLQSTFHVDEGEMKEPSKVAGQYLASGHPLAGSGQIDGLIDELQRLLKSKSKNLDGEYADALLQAWMSVECCLTADEHHQLLADVLNRLFTDYKAPTALCRDEVAQTGGY